MGLAASWAIALARKTRHEGGGLPSQRVVAPARVERWSTRSQLWKLLRRSRLQQEGAATDTSRSSCWIGGTAPTAGPRNPHSWECKREEPTTCGASQTPRPLCWLPSWLGHRRQQAHPQLLPRKRSRTPPPRRWPYQPVAWPVTHTKRVTRGQYGGGESNGGGCPHCRPVGKVGRYRAGRGGQSQTEGNRRTAWGRGGTTQQARSFDKCAGNGEATPIMTGRPAAAVQRGVEERERGRR